LPKVAKFLQIQDILDRATRRYDRPHALSGVKVVSRRAMAQGKLETKEGGSAENGRGMGGSSVEADPLGQAHSTVSSALKKS
jgi:hypothetical protein